MSAKKKPKPKEKKGLSAAEKGRKIATSLLTSGDIRYVRGEGWLKWGGRKGVWKLSPGRDADLTAYQCIIDEGGRYQWFGRAIASEAIFYLRTKSAIWPEQVNAERNRYINMKNGVYNIEAKTFIKGHTAHKEKFSTIQLPYKHIPGASIQFWEEFLNSTFPNPKLHSIIQEFFGSMLVGNANRFGSKAWFLIGEGQNGKSTFCTVCENFVGKENASAVDIISFGDKFQRIDLHHKLLNVASESGMSSSKGMERLKQLTGGDTIAAQPKYGDTVNFVNGAAMLFTMNTIPEIPDSSRGMAERIIAVPFDRSFFGDKADRKLDDKLAGELPGIFNWSLTGHQHLTERGYFEEPTPCIEAKSEFLTATNQLVKFAVDKLEKEIMGKVYCKDLQRLYESFCEDNDKPARYLNRLPSHLAKILPLVNWHIGVDRDGDGTYIIGACEKT